MTSVAAQYFDGKTSRSYQVQLTLSDGIAQIRGETERDCDLSQLHWSERTVHAARKVTFPDGAYLEIGDQAGFNLLLADAGYRDGWVVRLQQSWSGALLTLGTTLALLTLAYVFGLPAAARVIAFGLPVSMERQLGDGVLGYLDKYAFQPTELPPRRQQILLDRFQSLLPARADSPAFQVIFRKSKIGPNAFALPSGDIVLTDQIVELLADDEAVMGVLAHELGHLHERHLMRRIIQSSAIGAAATLIFGDVSTVLANIPTLLLDLKYSRDAESEADEYALAMLDRNGIAREHLAAVFEKLDRLDHSAAPYLSSHPSGQERILRIRGKPESSGSGDLPQNR